MVVGIQRRGLICLMLVLVFFSHSFAQEAATAEAETKEEDPFAKQRERVEMVSATLGAKDLELQKGPLYTYEEVIHDWHTGTSWVWGKKGRPVVFLNMMTQGTTQYHEFISLTDKAPSVSINKEMSWRPKANWNPTPIKGAPKPASRRKARLIQMRALARQFEGTQYQNGEEQPLRVLPQPIYRYGEESDESLDGAIFAFLRESDLETLLVIDAEKQEDGPPRWVFDCSRVSISHQEMKRKGKIVWSRPFTSFANVQRPNAPYHIYMRRNVR